MNTVIQQADFNNPIHRSAIVEVLNSYASDPVGGGVPLSDDVKQHLVERLQKHPTTFVLLAFCESRTIGIAICFFGFSTFLAKPLLNIHDLAVIPEFRGKGIGRALLASIEQHAKEHGCCKLTLEVQDDNRRARALYQSFGFGDYVLGASATPTRFLTKGI